MASAHRLIAPQAGQPVDAAIDNADISPWSTLQSAGNGAAQVSSPARALQKRLEEAAMAELSLNRNLAEDVGRDTLSGIGIMVAVSVAGWAGIALIVSSLL